MDYLRFQGFVGSNSLTEHASEVWRFEAQDKPLAVGSFGELGRYYEAEHLFLPPRWCRLV